MVDQDPPSEALLYHLMVQADPRSDNPMYHLRSSGVPLACPWGVPVGSLEIHLSLETAPINSPSDSLLYHLLVPSRSANVSVTFT